MAQKSTTGSESTFLEFENETWRGNAPPDRTPQPKVFPPADVVPDDEYPHLDPNDIWLYQRQIELAITRNIPENMNRRYLMMLRAIAARARICYQLEQEEGRYIGKRDL